MSINETLAQWSEMFMLLAGLTYMVAFVFFTWDWAQSSRTAPAMVTRKASEEALEHRKVLATVGAPGAPTARPLPEGDISIPYAESERRPARIGVALTLLAFVIHAAGVVSRGVAAGRVPWGNMYEFCTTGALMVAGVFLLMLIKRDLRFLGTFVVGLVLVMMCAATIGFPTPVAQLVPALQSYWLIIHVSVAVLASAIFTLTFAMGVLQLMQERRARLLEAGRRTWSFLASVPSAKTLENLSYRFNTIGFVMWTFTLMAGAIWAEKAWGRYWGWDVKEVWTFIIWVVYAGYLHARATRGWTGTRSAWLSITGYACIIFNFTVVNLYFSGLHSYSGV